MNGLHKVVVFHPLKSEELDEVLESELGNFQKRMLDSTMRPFPTCLYGEQQRSGRLSPERTVVRLSRSGRKTFGRSRSFRIRVAGHKDRRYVWTHKYVHDEAVSERNVSALVAAIDRNVHRGLDEVVESLEQYFSSVKTTAPPMTP